MSNASTDSDVTPPIGSRPAPAESADPTGLNSPSIQTTEAVLSASSSRQTFIDPQEPFAIPAEADVETLGEDSSAKDEYSSPRPFGRPPRFLGEYEILDEIARGGMGVVYRARQDKLNRFVALKLIRDSSLAGPADLRRFRAEAEAVAQLDHPHIVPIYEIGQIDDQPYFSMRLIAGGNLTDHIPRLQQDSRAAAVLIAKVARAVHYAHQRTILHRDIKPSNILLDEIGEPYVTDFGLAKRIGPDIGGTAATVPGMVMGTPAYMPPEQARGDARSVTTAADVYSLGATLYTALLGRAPFAGDSAAEIMRQVLDQSPSRLRSINPKLHRDLETICLKCLEKEPGRRYGSAEAMAEDLERWLAGMPIMARPVPAWERAVMWVRRQRALAALLSMLFLALLSLIGGGIWFTLELRQERDLANRGQYAANMNLARRALDDGLIYQVREQLKIYRSGPRALSDLRGFEWYYLANLCDPAPIRLLGHRDAVICVAFHPDGKRVVSGGTDGTVRIWDLAGRREAQIIEGEGRPIKCVAVSPDGCWLAAGELNGKLRLWELKTGLERALVGHKSGLRSVAFGGTDSLHLLSVDSSGLILQWDVSTGKREFELLHRHESDEIPGSSAGGTNVREFGPGTIAVYGKDGRTIVSVGMDEWLVVWDASTHQKFDEKRINRNVFAFSISPDGRQLALGMESAAVDVLDIERLHERPRVFSVGGRRATVTFSPDGHTIAVRGHTGGVRLLDDERGQILNMFEDQVNMTPNSLAFGAEGRLLAMAAGAEVRVLRATPSHLDGTTLAANQGPIRRLAASSDDGLLALGLDDGKIAIWDLRLGRSVQTLRGHGFGVLALAFVNRPDGSWLASAGGDGLVHVWDPRSGGEPLRTLPGNSGAVYAVAVRPDGRQIATGGGDGHIRTWDPVTGRSDLPLIEHGSLITALAYDPTGLILASGGMDRTVRVWSAASGARRLRPLVHPYQVTSLTFSPNGRLLAGGGAETDGGGKLLIWNASSGAIATRIDCPRGVDCASFSFDSRRIATCGTDDIVVQVWDVTGGHETLSLTGHTDRVSAVLFACHGLRLYSAGRDGLVKLWDGSATAPAE
jgi:eukaryotic-like serine/threonine-protein kinase